VIRRTVNSKLIGNQLPIRQLGCRAHHVQCNEIRASRNEALQIRLRRSVAAPLPHRIFCNVPWQTTRAR
jgi:hypothetical protein